MCEYSVVGLETWRWRCVMCDVCDVCWCVCNVCMKWCVIYVYVWCVTWYATCVLMREYDVMCKCLMWCVCNMWCNCVCVMLVEIPSNGNIPALQPGGPFGTTRNTATVPANSCLEDGFWSGASNNYWLPYQSAGSLDTETSPFRNCLQRRYNAAFTTTFDTTTEVQDEIDMTPATDNFYAFWNEVETGSHVPPHTYVNGHMTTGASSFDPLFFMHHNMIDWVCEKENIYTHIRTHTYIHTLTPLIIIN